jgi:predicted RNA binding protein YcfA (HicA-like mRNA interferase family)
VNLAVRILEAILTVAQWPSSKASRVFRALLRNGYSIKSQRGSHIVLTHPERGAFVWAFHDNVEIGPKMLARIAKQTGLSPEDL